MTYNYFTCSVDLIFNNSPNGIHTSHRGNNLQLIPWIMHKCFTVVWLYVIIYGPRNTTQRYFIATCGDNSIAACISEADEYL